MQLIRIGLEHPDLRFEIFYGASYNERAWWDNHRAYDYGYRPTGRAEDYREHAMAEQAKLQAGSGRRLLPGRHVLQHGVRRRQEPDRGLEQALALGLVLRDTAEIIRLAVLHVIDAELRQRPAVAAFQQLDHEFVLAPR